MFSIIWVYVLSYVAGLFAPDAYLDPGSGSYLLQLLIAGAMGALLMLRIYWGKVKGFFARLLGREVPEEDEE
ncbi:MAG: hypothetical protein ACLFWD_10755 [Anaerolineales bacterium]